MSSGLLFFTAHCDYKAANRVLLELRDLEFGSEDRQHVVLSRSEKNLDSSEETEAGSLTKETFDDVNEWAGASLKEVENYIQAEKLTLFLVVDDKALAEGDVIIVEEHSDEDEFSDEEEEDDDKPKDKPKYDFHKARFALDEAYSVWCNLDISNMDWEDFCHQSDEPDEEGWWDKNTKEEMGAEPRDDEELEQRRKLEEEFAADGKI